MHLDLIKTVETRLKNKDHATSTMYKILERNPKYKDEEQDAKFTELLEFFIKKYQSIQAELTSPKDPIQENLIKKYDGKNQGHEHQESVDG